MEINDYIRSVGLEPADFDMKEIAVIGDITVKASKHSVLVMVDDEVQLFMSRLDNQGLGDLIATLQSLVINDSPKA